jgi:hypothetical protein
MIVHNLIYVSFISFATIEFVFSICKHNHQRDDKSQSLNIFATSLGPRYEMAISDYEHNGVVLFIFL